MSQQQSNRSSLREEATLRASAVQEGNTSSIPSPQGSDNVTSTHPLQVNTQEDTSVVAENARKEWRNHGEGVTQSLEERRRGLGNGLVVRVISAEERVDPSGSTFTAYVLSVALPNNASDDSMLVEHRYSDFCKLHALLKKHNIHLDAGFPSKHWAGRMGNWTPSQKWAPQEHDNLVAYRKVQLDLWLVELCEWYNRDGLPEEPKKGVWEFLTVANRQPCDCVNEVEASSSSSSPLGRIKWSNPLSFTLGSSIRQAAYMVRYMTSGGPLFESDQSIPLDLLRHAKGLCFLTVAKAGLVVSGRMGTGLVVARRDKDNKWSAPSALGTVGMGWGALVGGDITHYLVVFTTMQGIDTLSRQTSVQLGAEMGVAVGPVGRGASLSTGNLTLQPAYAYAHSQGFFVGMSLEGSVVSPRHDVNAKFYGKSISPKELLLENKEEPPLAAQPLYDALEDALRTDIPQEGFRPSQLWTKESNGSTSTPKESSTVAAATETPTSADKKEGTS